MQSYTGSGKTGAYLLPLVNRLLERRSYINTSAVILLPTRELAEQVYEVLRLLAERTQIT